MTKKLLLLGIALMATAGISYAASHAESGTMTAANEMKWQPAGPNSPLQVMVLWGDRTKGEHGILLKLSAGFVAPIHAHTGAYHGINIQGTWRHSFDGGEERDLPQGSYVFQPGKGMHGDACIGTEDCIIFIHQKVKADFIPKQ